MSKSREEQKQDEAHLDDMEQESVQIYFDDQPFFTPRNQLNGDVDAGSFRHVLLFVLTSAMCSLLIAVTLMRWGTEYVHKDRTKYLIGVVFLAISLLLFTIAGIICLIQYLRTQNKDEMKNMLAALMKKYFYKKDMVEISIEEIEKEISSNDFDTNKFLPVASFVCFEDEYSKIEGTNNKFVEIVKSIT